MTTAAIPEEIPEPARERRFPFTWTTLVTVAAAAVAFGVILFSYDVFNDGDTYWHIAAGRWMLAHHQVLSRDVFSYTHAGQPWMSHEWFSEILMALAFGAGGWNGLLILFALSGAATAVILAAESGRKLGGISLPIMILVAFSIMSPSVLARPHLLALTCLVAWTAVMLRAREARRAPRLGWVLVMTLWANLHGSFIYGFLVAGTFGLEALFDPGSDRLKTLRDWALFGVATLAAACVSPHGYEGLIYPIRIMSMTTLNHIGEWKPLNFGVMQPLELGLLAVLYMGMVRGAKVPPLRLLLLLLLLHLSLTHQRYQIVLAATAPLILAEPIAGALGQGPRRAVRWGIGAAGFAVLALAMLVFRYGDPAKRHDDFVTPQTAMNHVPAGLLNQPVLNTYDFGGYLIFHGIKPFIDGRADMYGDAFMQLHNHLMRADQPFLDQTIAKYGIQWMLLSPREPLAHAMQAKPGWTEVYVDNYGAAFVKDEALAPSSARPGEGRDPDPKR